MRKIYKIYTYIIAIAWELSLWVVWYIEGMNEIISLKMMSF